MNTNRGWYPIAVWLALTSHAPSADLTLFEAVEPHMGTLVQIRLYATGEQQAAAGFRAAFHRIAQLDAALSDYKPDSDNIALDTG